MSIFTKQALVASFPAYDVFAREADHTGYVNITAADTLGLDSGRGYFRTYSPGSVVSYALQYNECPIKAVEDCRRKMVEQPYNGHKLHWINANATVLTSHARAKETLVQVTIGMRVRFEGLHATIEADHNNNLKFVPVADAE
jgi:hypothetical protein